MKRLLFISLFILLLTGCTKNTSSTVSKKFPHINFVTVASSLKTREKPNYEWVTKSDILFKNSKLKEFLKVTHIFDDPKSKSSKDSIYFYKSENPNVVYRKDNNRSDWKKVDDDEIDDYSKLNQLFINLETVLKEEPSKSEEIKYHFTANETAKKLAKLDDIFKDYKDDDKIKVDFKIAKENDKLFIKDVLIEVYRFELLHIKKNYLVLNIDKEDKIKYPSDLVRTLVRDGVKNYTIKEK